MGCLLGWYGKARRITAGVQFLGDILLKQKRVKYTLAGMLEVNMTRHLAMKVKAGYKTIDKYQSPKPDGQLFPPY